ncbi:MAG: hypothetical protein ACXVNO_10340 [Bacteroidia bacterium]
MKLLSLLLALLLFLPLLFNISPWEKPVYNNKEIFDPSLSKINSITKLIGYSDSAANINHIKIGSLGYGVLVGSIIRKRFYHGFSYYPLQKNWLAVTAQFIFGRGLASPVNPDEILKYPYAGCSQQAIVMMSVMKEKKVPFRSVGFPHHYATELYFKKNWYFFDSDKEPKIRKEERKQAYWKGSADSLKKFYREDYQTLNWTFGNSVPVIFGIPNADPAPHASIFQTITKYLSKILWIFPLLFLVYQYKGKYLFRK